MTSITKYTTKSQISKHTKANLVSFLDEKFPTRKHGNVAKPELVELILRWQETTLRADAEILVDRAEDIKPLTPAGEVREFSSVHDHNLMIQAYAGTGKTFTLIIGLVYAFAPELMPQVRRHLGFEPVPSPEQKRVWDALKNGDKPKVVTYCAFNNSIVDDFGTKYKWLVDALDLVGIALRFRTINSLGNAIVRGSYGYCRITGYHTQNLLAAIEKKDINELRSEHREDIGATEDLVGYCKQNLLGFDRETGTFNPDDIRNGTLDVLCDHFGVVCRDSSQVYRWVRRILWESIEVEKYREIDFDDQNWLPIVNNLEFFKSGLVLVDESQDLNRCKQEFCLLYGKRIVVVGDERQAIYGFAGADTKAMGTLAERLKESKNGLSVLRLTETRRCGKAIVAEAQQYVSDFKAHESNPSGEIAKATLDKYAETILDKDMVLCRVNAPLVSQALRLLRDGRKVVIRGRDFGAQLLKFVKDLKATDPSDLIEKLMVWVEAERTKELRKKFPSDAKISNMEDRRQCIEAFCEGATTINEVTDRINQVFAGKQCPKCKKSYNEDTSECFSCKCKLVTPKGILFSSVHRAKGLEADNVFILRVPGADMPHPMAKKPWEREQELNLIYVAVTRAIHRLTYVTV